MSEEDLLAIRASLTRLEQQLKKKPGRPVIWTALALLLTIQGGLGVLFGLISALSHH